MAAAVLSAKPFRVAAASPIPSSSSQAPEPPPDSSSKTFQRLRSSLEQSLRTATRSKKSAPPPPVDDFAAFATVKGKERAQDVPPPLPAKDKEKERVNVLRRVTFRRAARDSASSSPVPPPTNEHAPPHGRVAGFTSFLTPSMRQASMSSPALHLSSQALPSPKSQPAVPASSSSNADVLVSPSRPRTRKPSLQITTPTPTPSRHRPSKSYTPIPPSPSSPSLHHGSSALRDPPTPTPTRIRSRDRDPDPDTPTPTHRGQLVRSPSAGPAKPKPVLAPRASSPGPVTASAVRPRSPSAAATKARVVTPTRGLVSASTSHLPLASPTSPSPPPTPTKRRPSLDPGTRRVSLEAPRRPSIDGAPRRSSRDGPAATAARDTPSPTPIRPRAVSPTQRSYAQNRHFNISSGSLVPSNGTPLPGSPTPTSKPASPSRILRNPDATPRDLIRAATSLICKEVQKPPAHMCRTEQGLRDWEEVETRTRNLVRLERSWSKATTTGGMSSARRSSIDVTSSGAAGSAFSEDRERKVFCEALKDGYVLCQLMNKLRQSNIVRPDVREDGVLRTANITKFLAACASYGLPNEDLFLRDDLMEAALDREAAVRVARTVIRLVSFVEDGEDERRKEREKGKWIRGGGLGRSESSQASQSGTTSASASGKEGRTKDRERERGSQDASSTSAGTRSPYGTLSSASSRATASTPNLLPSQLHAHLQQQAPLSPRKKWRPSEDLTPLRSSSPEGSTSGNRTPNANARSKGASRAPQSHLDEEDSLPESASRNDEDSDSNSPSDDEEDDQHDAVFNPVPVPTMMKPPPPPRSPLRKQPSQKKLEGESGGLFAWARKAAAPGPGSDSKSKPSQSGLHSSVLETTRGLTPSSQGNGNGNVRDSVADSTRASVGDASVFGYAYSGDGDDDPHQYHHVHLQVQGHGHGQGQGQGQRQIGDHHHQHHPHQHNQHNQQHHQHPHQQHPHQHRAHIPSTAYPPPSPSHHHAHGHANQRKVSGGSSVGGNGNVSSNAPGTGNVRQSVVSETETTLTSAMSSLLDGGRNSSLLGYASGNGGAYGGGGGANKFGTIRTVTTDMTSEAPSVSRTEGSRITKELELEEEEEGEEEEEDVQPPPGPARRRMSDGSGGQAGKGMFLHGHGHPHAHAHGHGHGHGALHAHAIRERKVSGTPVLDLSRVAEEAEESVSSKGHGHGLREGHGKGRPLQGRTKSQEEEKDKGSGPAASAVHLRKGKWPDDFLNAFHQAPGAEGASSASASASASASGLSSALASPSPLSPSTSSSGPPSSSASPPANSHAQAIPGKHPYPQSAQHSSSSGILLDDGAAERGRQSNSTSTPLSISPPRKLAIVGARRSDGDAGYGQLPRRPTHRPRHSIDAPVVLLPKESILRREASPDSASSSGRVMLRRHTTKQGVSSGSHSPLGARQGMGQRAVSGPGHNGMGAGMEDAAESPVSSDAPVPFPRSVSTGPGAGEHGVTPSPRSSFGADGELRPRLLRGRFQSDVESMSSARARARPESYDELGVGAGGLRARSRFESMVNLGVASAATSSSDLVERDSVDGSVVRMRLVVREDGKPPTHFQLGNCIGRGQFGSVYRALNLNTGQMVAVKRIRLEGLKEEEIAQLMREVDLVKSLSHPSIVKYEGMARDDDTLNIVLEYAENGSLGQTLKSFGKLNEKLVASYVVKILEGLHYLHTQDVVHCDLKAANILTTKNGNVKLSDFGVSLNLRAMEREMKDVAGTPNWMAPEVIELKGASTKSDIWSLGCTVIELLTGRPPHAEIGNSMSVMFRIVEDEMPPLPEECSELLKDFLEQCFHKDPTKRPSAELLCEHPWLKTNWVALKELRPQDSIPFLRRVSTDLHKSDAVRFLSQLELSDSPVSGSPKRDEIPKISPTGRRPSTSSLRPLDNEISPREHTFVKTTFSKPMVCRVCLLNVKKSAVLCSQCSLISHSKCAVNAPPTCDLRAQLLLYAQYAEKGNPASVYSNPADVLHDKGQNVAMSDVPYVEHSTPRTSIDMASPPRATATPTIAEHPPTAFKFMAAFKRSRSNLSPEPVAPSSSSSTPAKDDEAPIKRRVLQKRSERPLSMTSTSTGVSSLRSAATAAESFSSRQDTGKRSQASGPGSAAASATATVEAPNTKAKRPVSEGAVVRSRSRRVPPSETTTNEPDDPPSTGSALSGLMPGDLKKAKKHKSKSSSSSNCTLQ